MKSVKVNFEYEATDCEFYEVEAIVDYVHEEFGADSDGNRGEYQWAIEDVREITITKDNKNVTEKVVSQEFYLLDDAIAEAANKVFEEE